MQTLCSNACRLCIASVVLLVTAGCSKPDDNAQEEATKAITDLDSKVAALELKIFESQRQHSQMEHQIEALKQVQRELLRESSDVVAKSELTTAQKRLAELEKNDAALEARVGRLERDLTVIPPAGRRGN